MVTIVTNVVTTRVAVRPPFLTATPVCTSWVWSESSRSIRRASAASSGLPRISPAKATVVSAATTRSAGDAVTASAFSRARRST